MKNDKKNFSEQEKYEKIVAFMRENAPMIYHAWIVYLKGSYNMGDPIKPEDRPAALQCFIMFAFGETEQIAKYIISL